MAVLRSELHDAAVWYNPVMLRQALVLACLLLGLAAGLVAGAVGAAKRPESPCSKPPALVSKQPLPKEERERAKKIRAQGSVAIVISEDGDVVDAKAVRPSSDEAGRVLTDLAKSMKFKARPGCGQFKTTMNFNLGE